MTTNPAPLTAEDIVNSIITDVRSWSYYDNYSCDAEDSLRFNTIEDGIKNIEAYAAQQNAELMADVKRLREAVLDYHYAQKRLLEKWADGDDNVKKDLWKLLHSCEDKGYEALTATDRPEYREEG